MIIVAPLLALGTLTLVLWVIAFCTAIVVILGYVSGALHGLPFPINQLAGPVKSLAQGLSNVVGKLEAGVDHLAGAAWHMFARYMDKLWHQTVWSSHVLLQAAEHIAQLAYSHLGIKAAVHSIAATARAAWHDVKRLERWSIRIEHRIHKLEHALFHGIGDDVLPRIKKVEREVAHVENKVIPAIEGEIATAEADVTALRKWITANIPLIGTTALAAAVAWALSSIGLGGLRCNSLLNSLKNRGCGLWSGLEDLLGLFIDAVLLTHLCDMPKWIEELFSPLLGELTGLISSAANSLCAAANPKWAKLDVQNGPLPPPQTLYLPDHFG